MKGTTAERGANRTGMGTSPFDGKDMIEGATAGVAGPPPGGVEELSRARAELAHADAPLGSVPPPTTVKGVVKATVTAIEGHGVTVLVDKLGDRLAFERSGTRLYDGLIAKLDATDGWTREPSRDDLLHFREEERRHAELVRQAIEGLGADPTVETPCADVAGVASMGLLQVVADPRTTLPQCLEAMLTAELTDHDGWQLLIDVARACELHDVVPGFEQALAEEEDHLRHVRAWLSGAVLREAA